MGCEGKICRGINEIMVHPHKNFITISHLAAIQTHPLGGGEGDAFAGKVQPEFGISGVGEAATPETLISQEKLPRAQLLQMLYSVRSER
jgi:hypothetical protein